MRTFPVPADLKVRRCRISIICADVRGGTIKVAADCQVSFDGGFSKSACGYKLRRYDDFIIGFVGSADIVSNFSAFYNDYVARVDDENPNIFNSDLNDGDLADFFARYYNFLSLRVEDFSYNHCSFLLIRGAQVFTIEGHTILPVEEYSAIGSGAASAVSAMDTGAELVSAVKISIDRNVWCGYPIEMYSINDKGKITHKIIKR